MPSLEDLLLGAAKADTVKRPVITAQRLTLLELFATRLQREVLVPGDLVAFKPGQGIISAKDRSDVALIFVRHLITGDRCDDLLVSKRLEIRPPPLSNPDCIVSGLDDDGDFALALLVSVDDLTLIAATGPERTALGLPFELYDPGRHDEAPDGRRRQPPPPP